MTGEERTATSGGRTDAEPIATVDDVLAHLWATEQRALEPTANRLLGEAQAIASDLVADPPDEETVYRRVETVIDLLSAVDGTGDDTADEHVRAAQETASALLDGYR